MLESGALGTAAAEVAMPQAGAFEGAALHVVPGVATWAVGHGGGPCMLHLAQASRAGGGVQQQVAVEAVRPLGQYDLDAAIIF